MNTTNLKEILAFDFDGVICDSVYECYLQALETYKQFGFKIEKTEKLEKQFREFRPFVLHGEDYFVFFKLIEKNPDINFYSMDQNDFDAEKEKCAVSASEYMREYAVAFYAQRKKMQKTDFIGWSKLHSAYPGIVNLIKELKKNYLVFIASAKDYDSIELLLAQFGLNFEKDKIISNEFSIDKREQVKEISQRVGTTITNVVLVEDILKQAKIVREVGAKSLLVAWGYSTPKQREEATGLSIPLVEKAEIVVFKEALNKL
jgi:phosphoglycolate phosphatase-like HAD superfamily hydrolase